MEQIIRPVSSISIDALFAEYVAGLLKRPEKVLVETHLDINPVNRKWVLSLEGLGGHSLDHGPEEAIEERDQMLASILNSSEQEAASKDGLKPYRFDRSDDWMPAPLRQFLGLSTKEIPWRRIIPGIHVYKMKNVDGCDVKLLRIKAGAAIPSHTHDGRELALVLKGSFEDGEGQYQRGDVSIADESVDHKPVAGMSEECICLFISDASVRFTGLIGRFISSFFPR